VGEWRFTTNGDQVANPGLSASKMLEALDAFEAHPEDKSAAARSIGIDRNTFTNRLQKAQALGREGLMRRLAYETPDPAIADSMKAVGTKLVPAMAWAKTGPDGRIDYSVLLKPQEERLTPEELADRIADRLNRVIAAPVVQKPKQASADLLNFVPWYDVHMGMRAGEYGTAAAVQRLREGTRDVLDRAPMAETLIIVCGGDFTEANDNSAQTPQSKHPLAVDIEFDDLSDIAVDVTIEQIEYGLTKAERVIYQPLKANHDPAMALILRQALRQRYRDNPRFVLKDGLDMFTHEWEGNLIAAIHGHQKVSKPETLTLSIAARHAKAWGEAKRRELWRGHHHKELTISVPGMRLFQVNPICPPGRYSNENLFTGESDIQCVTYGKGGGRRATTVHIFEE
jgi:hypothetical protein